MRLLFPDKFYRRCNYLIYFRETFLKSWNIPTTKSYHVWKFILLFSIYPIGPLGIPKNTRHTSNFLFLQFIRNRVCLQQITQHFFEAAMFLMCPLRIHSNNTHTIYNFTLRHSLIICSYKCYLMTFSTNPLVKNSTRWRLRLQLVGTHGI